MNQWQEYLLDGMWKDIQFGISTNCIFSSTVKYASVNYHCPLSEHTLVLNSMKKYDIELNINH